MFYKLSGSYKIQNEAAMGGFLSSMKNEQNKFWEFAFWVVLDFTEKGNSVFKYTEPQTNNTPHGVKLKSPTLTRKQAVTAYCHTHPGSMSIANFSADDVATFTELSQIFPGIAFYLLTPQNQIRLAQNPPEFPVGKTINWISSVKP